MPKHTLRELIAQHLADHNVNVERINHIHADNPHRPHLIESETERRTGYLLDEMAQYQGRYAAEVRREVELPLGVDW